jgi:serine phosphatase RsbU (regulator of sigma subunit)
LYSNPDTALVLGKEMQDFAQLKNEKHYEVFALQVQGSAASMRADNIRGIDYFTKALKIAEEINNLKDITNCINNIGVIYYEQGNNEKAMEYYLRSLEIAEKMQRKKSIAFALGNLGNVYKNLNQYDKAIEVQERSLKISEEIKDEETNANALHSLGVIYSDLKQDQKAIDYVSKALKIHEANDDKNSMSQSMVILGLSYNRLGQTAKGIEILKKALEVGKSGGFVSSIREASYNLYSIYKEQKNSTEALAMHELYIEMRDSIKNEEGQQAVMQQEMQYNYDKQKALDEKEQEKELAVSAEQEKKQKVISYSVGIGLLLVLIFSAFVFNRLRLKKKQKAIIEMQKDLVEEKQKEILDSITYAKRLQEAILPPQHFVKQHLPDSFIFYKPKDIVAGDFYWMEIINNNIFIAAADCTGHGVPGAMVSVVCSNALNRSVFEFGNTEPGKILDKARELVLETFSKSDTDVKDGMDISLACINKATREIKWAGANSPFWYTSQNEMKDLKANKQPIGKTENPTPFTTHCIQLQSGDSIFMLTDGFADQFGGDKGKKFKYKPLKDMLLQNANLPIESQLQELESAFITWKSNLEQVDDVCVIGVRL